MMSVSVKEPSKCANWFFISTLALSCFVAGGLTLWLVKGGNQNLEPASELQLSNEKTTSVQNAKGNIVEVLPENRDSPKAQINEDAGLIEKLQEESIQARKELEKRTSQLNYFAAISKWNEDPPKVLEAMALLESIPEKHRNIEWCLTRNQFEGGFATLYQHTSRVSCVEFFPDGKRIASASILPENAIAIWDAVTGDNLLTLSGHTFSVNCLAISLDGQWIVSGSRDKTVRVWDANTGEQLFILPKADNEIASVAISPDGQRIVSVDSRGEIVVWDANKREKLKSVKSSPRRKNLALDTLGKHVIYSSGSSIMFSDIDTDRVVKEIPADSFGRLVLTPDGQKIVATKEGHVLTIWDVTSGKQISTLFGHSEQITDLAVDSSGQFVFSGSDDRTIKMWDLSTGQLLKSFKGHLGSVSSVSVRPDGQQIVSGGDDGTLKLWDVTSDGELFNLRSPLAQGFSLSPDNRRIAMGGKSIGIWDAVSGELLEEFTGKIWPTHVQYSPDGKQIAMVGLDSSQDGFPFPQPHPNVHIVDAADGMLVKKLEGHTEEITCLTYSADGKRLFSGSEDEGVKVWDVDTGKELATLVGHNDRMTCMAVISDGKTLITAAAGLFDETIRIWDVDSGKELAKLSDHRGGIYCLAISPDGKHFYSGGSDHTIRMWDRDSRKILKTFKGHVDDVQSVGVSHDGSRIVAGSNKGTIKIWDAASTRELLTLPGKQYERINQVGFSSIAKRLITEVWLSRVKLWNTEPNQQVRILEGHSGVIKCLAMSSDGKYVASGSADGTVRVWDADRGIEFNCLEGTPSCVTCLAFSPDGQKIITGGQNAKIRIWDIDGGKLLKAFDGPKGLVEGLAMSSDGNRIVSCSSSTILVWDTLTGEELRRLNGHEGNILSVTISLDDKQVISESWNRRITWNIASGEKLEVESNFDGNGRALVGNSRWSFMAQKEFLIRIDMHFKDRPEFKKILESKTMLDVKWQTDMARIARKNNNSYSETIRRAWITRNHPKDEFAKKDFRDAYTRLQAYCKKENVELEPYLPAVVGSLMEELAEPDRN